MKILRPEPPPDLMEELTHINCLIANRARELERLGHHAGDAVRHARDEYRHRQQLYEKVLDSWISVQPFKILLTRNEADAAGIALEALEKSADAELPDADAAKNARKRVSERC